MFEFAHFYNFYFTTVSQDFTTLKIPHSRLDESCITINTKSRGFMTKKIQKQNKAKTQYFELTN